MINYGKRNYIILYTCSILHSLGAFGSKCTSKVDGTVWIHKNTCDCEKKTLVEYFKKEVSFRRLYICYWAILVWSNSIEPAFNVNVNVASKKPMLY